MPDDKAMTAISEALADGRKIEAIKIYREATGLGLKDAKDFIEALAPKLTDAEPEKHAREIKKSGGCSALLVFGVLLFGAGAVALFT